MIEIRELDQYDQGSYEGTFGVAHIGLGNWNWGDGRHVTELKATLSFIAINGVDDLPEDFATIGGVEPEDTSTKTVIESTNEAKPDNNTDQPEPPATESDLFSLILLQAIKYGEPVQLDPTVGRPKFPNQIARMLAVSHGRDRSFISGRCQ